MACPEGGMKLSRHLDGESGPEERAAMDRHLAGCAACREEIGGLAKNEALIARALGADRFVGDLVRSVMTRVTDEPVPHAPAAPARTIPPLRRWLPLGLASAAAVLFGITSLVLAARLGSLQDQQAALSETLASLRAQIGEDAAARNAANSRTPDPGAPVEAPPIEPGTPVALQNPPPVERPPRLPLTAGGPAVPEKSPGGPSQAGLSLPLRPQQPDPFIYVSAIPQVGGILLTWDVSGAKADTEFWVYRQEAPDAIAATPLNGEAIRSRQYYFDTGTRPTQKYWYCVGIRPGTRPGGGPAEVRSELVPVQAAADMAILFKGLAQFDKRQVAFFEVARYVEGRWVGQTFRMTPGDPVGGAMYQSDLQEEVSLDTGLILARAGSVTRKRPRETKVVALDPKTAKPLLNPTTGEPLYETRIDSVSETVLTAVVRDAAGREFNLESGVSFYGTPGAPFVQAP